MSSQPARPPLAGIAMVACAAASWGMWSLILRPTHLPSAFTTPAVFLIMGLIGLPFALRGPRTRWDRGTVALVFANAAFDGLNVLAYFAALDHTTVAVAVLTHYLAPILIALAAPRIDGVRVPGAGIAAGVALAGLIIILEPWRTAADGALIGGLLGVASAVCYAGNVFSVRRLAARIGVVRMQTYHSLVAGIALAPLALTLGHLGELTPAHFGLLVCGGATIGAASGIVFAIGLGRIGSARAAILTFIEPIVAVAVGVTVWGEPLHPFALLGGALVLGAGILVARNAR